MSEIFQLYEETFKRGIRKAQSGFNSALPNLDDIGEGLQQAEQQLGKMSIEYSSTRNPQMKAKVDVYRKQLQTYKRQLDKQVELSQSNQLFSGADKNNSEGYSNLQKIKDAKKQMYQNLDIQSQISQNLHSQTQSLQRTRGKLNNINGYLTQAHGLLNNIKKKMLKNKLVMWGVAFIFFIMFVIIIYSYI